MGLVDKLTEVDEAVWRQYEKVTQYCNKELGWDKYDLARKSNKGMLISSIGTSSYVVMEGIAGSSPSYVAVGVFILAINSAVYYCFEKFTKYIEKKESTLSKDGEILAPYFLAWRPPFIGFFMLKNVALHGMF